MLPGEGVQRLDEYTREEWWDVARLCNPSLTRAEFDLMWSQFLDERAERERLRELN